MRKKDQQAIDAAQKLAAAKHLSKRTRESLEIETHQKLCHVCNHPQRQELQDLWLTYNLESSNDLREFLAQLSPPLSVPSWKNHLRHSGLKAMRDNDLVGQLQRVIDAWDPREEPPKAGDLISAIKLQGALTGRLQPERGTANQLIVMLRAAAPTLDAEILDAGGTTLVDGQTPQTAPVRVLVGEKVRTIAPPEKKESAGRAVEKTNKVAPRQLFDDDF